MSKRVLKWIVPVDDEPHEIGGGPVVHIACQNGPGLVMVWTEEPTNPSRPTEPRTAQVYGTGHEVPDRLVHLGSTLALDGALVWHCYAEPGPNTVPL